VIGQTHSIDLRQIRKRDLMLRTARSFGGNVVRECIAQRVQLEFERRRLARALHRCALPLRLICEAHVHGRVLRTEAFDLCANRQVAIAPYGRIARRDENPAHRHEIARHVGAEEQMSRAVAPMTRPERE
jgi:hypothetical protein